MYNQSFVVGILDIQGNSRNHYDLLLSLGVTTIFISNVEHLNKINALIIPGGESTTMMKLLTHLSLIDKISNLIVKIPIFAICAGSIVVSNILKSKYNINLFTYIRNGYGRQDMSSIIKIKFNESILDLSLIRAPLITDINNKDVIILSSFNKNPIILMYKNILFSTGHPEIMNNTIIHKYFIDQHIC